MHRQKRVLVSWYTDPRYIPPFVLADRQVTVGPKVSPDQSQEPFDGFTPCGRYDLFAALEALHLPTEFDAVVVWSDALGENQPVNLEAFNCPTILCVGDTHHLDTPLQKMIDYQNDAKFDFILSSHNRHHLHWFIEAGYANVAWLPGIKVRNLSRPFLDDRKAEVCFFGSAGGKAHLRRTHLLRELNRRKAFPFVAMVGRRDHAADRYSTSAVSLNCSLNGDLNLRVFEILAAGGCLLTDRLSPQSGLDLLLREGKEFVGYDSVEECIEQARFLLAHPQSALAIARAGNDAFTAHMLPERRAQQLFDWVFQGQLDSLFRVDDFSRAGSRNVESLRERLQIYEQLQELNRVTQSASVLFMKDVPDVYALDALDLRQLKITIEQDDDPETMAKPHEIGERCTRMNASQLAATSWHCVVTNRDGSVPEFIRYKKLIRSGIGTSKAQTP
jgi:hypothetical protein